MRLRHEVVFLLLLAHSTMLFGQVPSPGAPTREEADVGALRSELNALQSRIAVIEGTNRSAGIKYLMSHYSDVFNRWLTVQGIMIAFLSGLSILLPLLTYFFGYKPAKDAETRLADIEKKFEEILTDRIATFLETKQRSEISNAVDSILSSDPEARALAASYIGMNQHYRIDDGLRKRVYAAITSATVPEMAKSPLRMLLFNSKSLWCDKYIQWMHSGRIPSGMEAYMEAKWLALNPTQDAFAQTDRNICSIAPSQQRYQWYVGLLAQASFMSVDVAIGILNMRNAIDSFNPQELVSLRANAISYTQVQGFGLDGTYLAAKAEDGAAAIAKASAE